MFRNLHILFFLMTTFIPMLSFALSIKDLKTFTIKEATIVQSELSRVTKMVREIASTNKGDVDLHVLEATCNTLVDNAESLAVILPGFQQVAYQLVASENEKKVLAKDFSYLSVQILNELFRTVSFCDEDQVALPLEFDVYVIGVPYKSVSEFDQSIQNINSDITKVVAMIEKIPEKAFSEAEHPTAKKSTKIPRVDTELSL